MSDKLQPEPIDRHADISRRSAQADDTRHVRQRQDIPRLASGSANAAHPAKSKPDAHPTVVEDGEHGPRGAKHRE